MNKEETLNLLNKIKDGEMSPDEAMLQLKMLPYSDLGFAKIDNHRGIRQGIHEVIFGQSKTSEQIVGIVNKMLENGRKNILITRLTAESAAEIQKNVNLEYNSVARLGIVARAEVPTANGYVVVATGGTTDIPVAEEAAITAEVLGCRVERMYDVGVAGLHRLLSKLDILMDAKAVVAVAGMEGALASVVGGLVDCPVIAVPTSIGYGASFGGVSALLTMLNSCASGVSVVNIDNGFGAGYLASMINRGGN